MGDNAIGSAVSLRGGNSAQEAAHQQPQSIPGGDGHGVLSSEVELGAIQRNSAPPRVSRGGSPMLAAVGGAAVGAGATWGITKGVETGAFTSFFTGAAIKSVASLASFVGVSALFTAISGFCFRKYSTQLNQLRQTRQHTGNLPFKKFLAGLSFIASTVATGLSTGALVTTMTGGSDFGMSLIIGGVSGLVAGLLGLLALGSHGHNQYHGGMTPASA